MARYIDKDDLFTYVGSIKPENQQQDEDIRIFLKIITDTPTENVKPIESEEELNREQAKWKRNETSLYYKCSNCKESAVMFPYPYCPLCGSKMTNYAKW